MNGSSPQTFSKSLQKPANLAMMASMVAHGFLFTGLALVPATGQQNAKKSLRVVSLLQPSPEQPGQPQQPVDPNAPPPAPGVAGLPFNITTPGDLPELSTTNTPNAAFDPFASSVVELPKNPQPDPSINPGLKPPTQPVPPPSNPPKPSNPDAPTLSDQDFQDWLNGTDELPLVFDDSGASDSADQPQASPGAAAAQSNIPPNTANREGISNPSDSNPLPQDLDKDPFKKPLAPPGQIIERQVAYNYPQAACADRLEGKAEYRIWVSAQGTPVVSGIVVSSNSDILDRAVKAEARKYKITAADADKLVTLPFDFKYSEKVCAVQNAPSTEPTLDPAVPKPSPGPNTDEPPEPTLEDKNGQQPSPTPSNPSVPPTQKVQPNPGPTPTEPTLPETTPSQPSPSAPLSPPQPVAPAPIAPTAPTTPSKSLSPPAVPVTPPAPIPAAPTTPAAPIPAAPPTTPAAPIPAAPVSPPAQGTPAPGTPVQPDATAPAPSQPIPSPGEGSPTN